MDWANNLYRKQEKNIRYILKTKTTYSILYEKYKIFIKTKTKTYLLAVF